MKINDLNLSGMELTVRKDDVEKSRIKKLDDVYEQHAKLVFLFDHSGSMNSRLSVNYRENFIWTDEFMGSLRLQANDLFVRLSVDGPIDMLTAGFDLTARDGFLLGLVDPVTGYVTIDDEEIQRRLIERNLTGEFNVPVNWEKHKEMAPTRLEAVKRLAKQEITNRLNKYPKSNIAVIVFDDTAELRFNDGKPEDLWPVIEGMIPAGGTRILNAFKAGLTACSASPSTIGIHHFVLVSDGEDYEASNNIQDWVANLKASGVILDYIHIGDRLLNAGLEVACKQLGGECVVVSTEADLQEKFMQAIQRKCIPAAGEAHA